MKHLMLAAVLLLVVTDGWALTCHYCAPEKAGGACEVTTETCSKKKDSCAAVRFLRQPYGHFQKCISDCETLKRNAFINAKCCQDDLCNTF